jgi:hypothetical protein
MLDYISDLVYCSSLTVILRWEEIAAYFDGLLAEKSGLLNPAYHDSLLIDDREFTRSKKYFWAIEFLQGAEATVLDNTTQIRQFVDLMKATPPLEVAAQNGHTLQLRKHLNTVQKLENPRSHFRTNQDETKALRDGVSHRY